MQEAFLLYTPCSVHIIQKNIYDCLHSTKRKLYSELILYHYLTNKFLKYEKVCLIPGSDVSFYFYAAF